PCSSRPASGRPSGGPSRCTPRSATPPASRPGPRRRVRAIRRTSWRGSTRTELRGRGSPGETRAWLSSLLTDPWWMPLARPQAREIIPNLVQNDATTVNDEPIDVPDTREGRAIRGFPVECAGNDHDHGSIRTPDGIPRVVVFARPPVMRLRRGEQF